MEFKLLESILDNLEPIVIGKSSFKPVFSYGTQADLIKFLRMKKKQSLTNTYPLIWLETPLKIEGSFQPFGKARVNIIIATITSPHISNRERVEKTFLNILEPLQATILERLKTPAISVGKEITVEKFFNYDTDSSHGATDIWDAISFKCPLIFNYDCII